MAFQHYRTKAVFLKKEDRGEADQLLTVFTKDFGRLEILAKAIRKITSKLRSGTGPFYLSEIEFIQGKSHKTLTDAFLLEKFKRVRQNPEKLDIAFRIAETIDLFLVRTEQDQRVWQLLFGTLEFLENSRMENLKIIYYYFLWNFLVCLGYQPELHFCPICRKKMQPETFYFTPQDGGVICWQCLKEKKYEIGREAELINVETVKVLRLFLKNPLAILKRIYAEKEHLANLARISDFYLEFLCRDFASFEN